MRVLYNITRIGVGKDEEECFEDVLMDIGMGYIQVNEWHHYVHEILPEHDTSFPPDALVQMAHVSIGNVVNHRTREREYEKDLQILVCDDGVYVRLGNDTSCLPGGG